MDESNDNSDVNKMKGGLFVAGCERAENSCSCMSRNGRGLNKSEWMESGAKER